MSRSLLRIGVCSGALVTLVPGFISSSANAQERWSVDAGVSGGVANNPYLETGKTPVSGSVSAQLSPSYITESALTTLQVSADLSRTEYFSNDYRANESYSLNGSGSHTLSERSRLSAQIGYVNAITGGFNDPGVIGNRVIIPGVTPGQPIPGTEDPIGPVTNPPISSLLPGVITDPSLGGIGLRRKSYQLGTGFNTQLGPRDSFYTSLSAVAARAKGVLDRYNYVSQGLGYSRTINDKLSVSADLSVGHSDYLGRRVGDSTFYQPGLGIDYRLDERTRISVNAGVSINRIVGLTQTTTTTSANGSASFCKQDQRWDACLSLSRATVPSAFQGVRTQNAASVSFGYRAGPLDSYSLSASYSRTGEALGDVVLPGTIANKTSYMSVHGGYNRTLSPRLSAFLDVTASRAKDNQVSRDANFEGRAGVRYRFGADR